MIKCNISTLTSKLILNMLISEYLKLKRGGQMLVEMRARSQFTLPSEIIKSLGISEGDKFEVMERDGGIFLCPVVVYPKAKLEQIAKIIKEHENNPSGVFESVEDMFKEIGIDIEGGNV